MKLFTGKDFVVLFLLVLAPLIFFSFAKSFSSVTGAVIFGDDVKPDVELLVFGHPLTRLAAVGAKVCILVDDGSDSLSFSVVKTGKDSFNVSESVDKYCSGAESEDFILEYVSFDALKSEALSSSCDSFKRGWKGDSYYFLISKQVLPGGDIVCDDYFSNNYCGAVNFCYTPEEIESYKLDCCVDYVVSESDAIVIEELASEGVVKGFVVDMRDSDVVSEEEVPVVEAPSSDSGFDYLTWIGFPVLIIVLVVVLVLLKGGVFAKKVVVPVVNPVMVELQNYVVNTIRLGYPPEQVYHHLLQQGWHKDIVDSVFQNIYKQK